MNLRRYARLTVWRGEEARRVVLEQCAHCASGTMVWLPVGLRSRGVFAGHVAVGRFVGPASLATVGGCPGDVRLSSQYGNVMRRSCRTVALVHGVRYLVRLSDELRGMRDGVV